MFDKLRHRIAQWFAPSVQLRPPPVTTRQYAAARPSRTQSDWVKTNSSADSELQNSLTNLRARSRQLVRDAPYAKRAKTIVMNNVIGAGIGLQAQVMTSRDELSERVNDAIENAWAEWARGENCHTGGALHFCDLERAIAGQMFEAGEVVIRKHYSKFGKSAVPLALELIEAERLADDQVHPVPSEPGAKVRMGVEADRFGRAVAYWIRESYPGETRVAPQTAKFERVPAAHIMHLRLVDRWPQTRGEPWLHASAMKLNDVDGYSEAEIIAARGGAAYMGSIESEEGTSPLEEVANTDGSSQVAIEPGLMVRLRAGEKLNFNSPNRPNTALPEFMRAMLREIAAGTGVSYESLSRDYSQSNYSSSRLSLLDDRDTWRVLQQWFIRSFREPLHREWISLAMLARAIAGVRIDEYAADPAKFEAVRFKPRGWSWVDPTKEVAAYKEAILGGLTTVTDVIAATGGGQDIEDVLKARERELKLFKDYGIEVDTTFDPKAEQPVAPAPAPPKEEPDEPKDKEDMDERDRAAIADMRRQVDRMQWQADRQQVLPPVINVTVPEQAVPVINVAAPEVRIEPAVIHFTVPELPAPVIHVAAPEVRVEAPVVHVAAPMVQPTINVAASEIRLSELPAPIVNVTVPEAVINVAAPEVRIEQPVINVAPAEITVQVTPKIEARLQQSDSVTRHTRDQSGELVESATTYGAGN